jgi:endonuclease-8
MPEGDTIFKLAAFLAPALSGRRIVSGAAHAATRVTLDGRQVETVYARGKHLFIAFDLAMVLRSHLGMRGSWHHYPPGATWQRPRQQASIVLDVGDRVYVCFNAKQVELVHHHGVREKQLETMLGQDLLGDSVDYGAIVERARTLSDDHRPIADVLLDQRIACGIGNVYKSESLFLRGWHPARPLGSVPNESLQGLYHEARRQLGRNLRGGPRVTRRTADGTGRLWVYGRTAQPCLRCDTPIVSAMLGAQQRSTFWCPRCQADERVS